MGTAMGGGKWEVESARLEARVFDLPFALCLSPFAKSFEGHP
jgi:hypothetical protein